MKDLLKNIKTLREKILAIELEIDILECDLITVKADTVYLQKMKEDLIYNINFLKKEGVVPSMTEYKKSIEKIKQVDKKLMNLADMKNVFSNKLNKRLEDIEYYNDEFDKAYRLVENEPVVLVFNKKGKNE